MAVAQQIKPQPGPQTKFVECDADVVFYGGAAGGGKSYALLLDILYDYANPKFGAVIFRRTTKQILNEGGLWDTAGDLYGALGAKMLQSPSLSATFATGARVTFAHMEHEKNRFDWQGSQIPMIGFDELTHFTWKQFSYMLSRNRSVCGARNRIRGTCNPDPDSWVREFIDWYIGDDGYVIDERSGVIRWFVVEQGSIIWGESRDALLADNPDRKPKSFTFIKSSLHDNQILMQQDPNYESNLEALDRVERERLAKGNWNIRESAGMVFRRSDFEIVEAAPKARRRVRAWDLAGTKKTDQNAPDWTVGTLMSLGVDGIYYIEHVERMQENPAKVDAALKNTASADGHSVRIRIPQDPGQAGKSQASQLTKMLAGHDVVTLPVTGDKLVRARPLAAQAQAGNVKIVRGRWNDAFLEEMENFPEGGNDDQVDSAADAFNELATSSQYNLDNV